MNTHIQDHVFADGVDQHGNLIVKIGPGHLLARMNAVDRSRLISGAPALLEAIFVMMTTESSWPWRLRRTPRRLT